MYRIQNGSPTGGNLVGDPSFESGWGENKERAFPATSIYHGTWGIAQPRTGSYAYAISNLAFGHLWSSAIGVTGGTQYDVYASLRGEIDAEGSGGCWLIRAQFYNSAGGALGYADAASECPGSLSETWQRKGSRLTAPTGAATMRLALYNYFGSGWVAWDDVEVYRVENGQPEQANLVADAGFEGITDPAASVERKYYYAGGTRIAMREGSGTGTVGLRWLFGDHLGSTSITADGSGVKKSELRYKAWGAVRYTEGTTPTTFQYTGQRNEDALGFYFFEARWVDMGLGRFMQADTLIPGAGNPAAWDRYALSLNNPINYIDPSGHASTPAKWSEPEDCQLFSCVYNVLFTGNWTYRDMMAGIEAVKSVGSKFAEVIGGTASSAFNAVFQNRVTLAWVSSFTDSIGNVYTAGAITKSPTRIEIASLSGPGKYRSGDVAFVDARNNIVHEFSHAFAQLWYGADGAYDQSGPYGIFAPIPSVYLNNEGFYPSPVEAPNTWRQHPCSTGDSSCPNETIADQFLGWTFGKWADDKTGMWRNHYMTVNMVEWIPAATNR